MLVLVVDFTSGDTVDWCDLLTITARCGQYTMWVYTHSNMCTVWSVANLNNSSTDNQTTTSPSFKQTTFSTKGHSNTAIPSYKPTCHPINSMESLLPLPVITGPFDFCTCLNLRLSMCHKIANDYPKVNEQTREIAFKWYNQQANPCWEEFVGALVCLGSVGDAKRIADANGVDYYYMYYYYYYFYYFFSLAQ